MDGSTDHPHGAGTASSVPRTPRLPKSPADFGGAFLRVVVGGRGKGKKAGALARFFWGGQGDAGREVLAYRRWRLCGDGVAWRASVTFRQKLGPRVGAVSRRALKLRRGAEEGTVRKGVMVFAQRALGRGERAREHFFPIKKRSVPPAVASSAGGTRPVPTSCGGVAWRGVATRFQAPGSPCTGFPPRS